MSNMSADQLGVGYNESDIQRQVLQQLQAQGVPMGDIDQNSIGVNIQESAQQPQVYDYDSLSAAEKRALESDPQVRHIQQQSSGIMKVDQYGNPIDDNNTSSSSYGGAAMSGVGQQQHQPRHHNQQQQQQSSYNTSSNDRSDYNDRSEQRDHHQHHEHNRHHERRNDSNDGDRPAGISAAGGSKYNQTNRNDNSMYNGVNLPSTSSNKGSNYQSQPMKHQQQQQQYQPQQYQPQQQQRQPEQNKCCIIM